MGSTLENATGNGDNGTRHRENGDGKSHRDGKKAGGEDWQRGAGIALYVAGVYLGSQGLTIANLCGGEVHVHLSKNQSATFQSVSLFFPGGGVGHSVHSMTKIDGFWRLFPKNKSLAPPYGASQGDLGDKNFRASGQDLRKPPSGVPTPPHPTGRPSGSEKSTGRRQRTDRPYP